MGMLLLEMVQRKKPEYKYSITGGDFGQPFTAEQVEHCEHVNIPNLYSERLTRLLDALLQVNPANRPTAKEILYYPGVIE